MLGRDPHPFPTTAEGQLALVLFFAWDPIGGPPDEYRLFYPSRLLELLRDEQPTGQAIAEVLGKWRTERMGLKPDPGQDLRAAWAILNWYRWFVEDEQPSSLDHREA